MPGGAWHAVPCSTETGRGIADQADCSVLADLHVRDTIRGPQTKGFEKFAPALPFRASDTVRLRDLEVNVDL